MNQDESKEVRKKSRKGIGNFSIERLDTYVELEFINVPTRSFPDIQRNFSKNTLFKKT